MGEEAEVASVGEAAEGLRSKLVCDGAHYDLHYEIGQIPLADQTGFCSIIAVGLIENRILACVPVEAWTRKVSTRLLHQKALQRPICCSLAACGLEDRELPGEPISIRVWFGFLNPDLEDQVAYDREEEAQVDFKAPQMAERMVPFAEALGEVAAERFTFQSADSGGGNMDVPPAGPQAEVSRLDQMEDTIKSIQESLSVLVAQQIPRQPGATAQTLMASRVPRFWRTRQVLLWLEPTPGCWRSCEVPRAGQNSGSVSTCIWNPGKAPRRNGPASLKASQKDGRYASDQRCSESRRVGRKCRRRRTQCRGGSGSSTWRWSEPYGKSHSSAHQGVFCLSSPTDQEGDCSSGSSTGWKRFGLQCRRYWIGKLKTEFSCSKGTSEMFDRASRVCLPNSGESFSCRFSGKSSSSRRTTRRWGWLEARSRITNFQPHVRWVWAVGAIWDCLCRGDTAQARARAALLVAAADQTSIDGVFSVVKSLEVDRLILDSRPPNPLEVPCQRFIRSRSLASADSLCRIQIPPGHCLKSSGNDLRDFYYLFSVSNERARRNALAGPITIKDAKRFSCYRNGLDCGEPIFGALSTLAMGDTQAVSLAQTCHLDMALQTGIASSDNLLTLSGPVPRVRDMVGIIIDDFVTLSICPDAPEASIDRPPASESVPSRGALLASKMQEFYKTVGLIPHEGKAFRDELSASFWGADVDGKLGVVRGSLKRCIPLCGIVLQICKLRVCTVELLEIISGSLISLLLFRRRMLVLLEGLFHVTRDRAANDIVKLSNSLVNELLVIATLLPLSCSNLRAETNPIVVGTDASDCRARVEL